ncbi:MAG TPA: hypothetical protein VK163_08890 [Opitutaceae bacterium]|nr:hypothetical protein [Opitutaceae bacterium]
MNHDNTLLLEGLTFFGLLGVIWFFGVIALRKLALDYLRQNLFSIRGQLFDEVLRGKTGLGFDSKVYHQLRSFLNNSIQFGYLFAPSHYYAFKVAGVVPLFRKGFSYRQFVETPKNPLDELAEGEFGETVKVYRQKVYFEVAKYLLLTSPIFQLIVLRIVAWKVVSKIGRMTMQEFLRQITGIRNSWRSAVGAIFVEDFGRAYDAESAGACGLRTATC